tara:strand:+ start:1649 stop:2452 length:804 start_codon:yes stop_codon:yes gene_type:complete
MTDRQKGKVYNWEDSLIPTTNELSKQECIHIINELNKVYGCLGRLNFVNRNQNADAQSNGLITIPTGWAMCWKVLLHEYAHVLCFGKYGWRDDVEVHGKEFVTTYCTLLKNFHPTKPTYKKLAQSLNEKNIEFLSFDTTFEKKAKRRTVSLSNFKEDKFYDELTTTRVAVTSNGAKRYFTRKTRIDKICFVILALKKSEFATTLPLEKVLKVFKLGFIPAWEGRTKYPSFVDDINKEIRVALRSMPKVTIADLKYIDKHKRGIKLIT